MMKKGYLTIERSTNVIKTTFSLKETPYVFINTPFSVNPILQILSQKLIKKRSMD